MSEKKYLLYHEDDEGCGRIYVREDVDKAMAGKNFRSKKAAMAAQLYRLPEVDFQRSEKHFKLLPPNEDGIHEVKPYGVRIYGWIQEIDGVKSFMAAKIIKKTEQEVDRDVPATVSLREKLAAGEDYVSTETATSL